MPDKFALLIGNSEYKDKRLPPLATPRIDARGLAEVLLAKTIGGFDKAVTLINKSEKTIRLAIAQFCTQRHPDDTLVLYFSGHGVKDSHGRLYLAVADTNRDLLSATAVPAAFIQDQLNGCDSRRQILILDCCYSGAFVHAKGLVVGASVGTEASFQVPGYGRVTLTASDSTEYAWEGDQGIGKVQPSIFTRHLIEGLKTGDADLRQRGYITADDLYQYANREVLRSGSRQKPKWFADEQETEIFIANNPQPGKEPAGEKAKPVQIKLLGKDGRLFAGTSFRVDNTSQAYYQSPYFTENRARLQPIPRPRINPPRMSLSDVLEKSGIQAIQAAKTITFHAVGDTGAAKKTGPQTVVSVANMMVADVQAAGATAPAFFFHLGDVIYYFAENKYYYDQFYAPFQDYDRPIFAVPGNHDGMVYDPAVPTLTSFLRNFCAPKPGPSADSGEHVRSVMTQPGVYFTLDAPFVSIIGLYSNVLMGPGSLSLRAGKSAAGETQFKFLEAELKRLKRARAAVERAVILAIHHPPLSVRNFKMGPSQLSKDIDRACRKAGLWPDAILSSHAHLYQRFTRRIGKRRIPYIVAGTGGFGLSQPAVPPEKAPYTVGDFTLETGPIVEFGYLTVSVDMTTPRKQLIVAFHSPKLGHNVDRLVVDL